MTFIKKTNKNEIRCQCGSVFAPQKLLALKDDDKYTDREIFVGYCLNCSRINTVKVQTDLDGNIRTIHKFSSEANRMLKREKSNIINLQELSRSGTYGLCYGVNKEIRNKKGEVTQIRQYACDFNNKTDLIKKVITK